MATLHHSLLPDLPTHWSPLCVSRLHFHVTWLTRGRRKILSGDRAATLRSILTAMCGELGVRLEALGVLSERIHLLISLRPSDCAGSVVRELKGRSALELLSRRPELRVLLGGNLVWDETYGISTVSPGNLGRKKMRLERIQDFDHRSERIGAACSKS